MTQKATYFAPISNLIGSINHALSGLFFESRPTSTTSNAEKSSSSYLHFESFDFSKPDQSELLINEQEIDPLLEAEVYAIYGRRKDAERVLDSALKAGQVSPGEIALFWSLRDTDHSTPNRRSQ